MATIYMGTEAMTDGSNWEAVVRADDGEVVQRRWFSSAFEADEWARVIINRSTLSVRVRPATPDATHGGGGR